MRHFTCESGTEVTGTGVLAYLNNIQVKDFRSVVEKVELTNIDPDGWYPLERVMNLFNELHSRYNMSMNLVAVGMAIVENATSPPGMENATLVEILKSWNSFLQINHRNGDVGSIHTEEVAPDHLVITLSDVYPDDFSYGIAYQQCKTHCPSGKTFTVKYEEGVARMDEGNADKTRLHIRLKDK